MALSVEQQKKITELAAQGMSQRKIAEELGIGHKAVRLQLEKQHDITAAQTVTEIATRPEIQEQIEQNVFDITTGLQACLDDLQALGEDPLYEIAPFKERVAVIKARSQILMNAAVIREKVYNAAAVEMILQALFAEYEQEAPDIQRRILQRIGDNPLAASLLALLGNSPAGPPGQ
jgi:hypothetical protein